MKNSLNTCKTEHFFSYNVPCGWKKNDILPCKLSTINLLFEFLSEKNYLPEEIIQLREDHRFRDLYIKIHRELEEGVGVLFFPNFDNNKCNIQERSQLFLRFCQFIGDAAPINKNGETVREVKDHGVKDSTTAPVRGHLTSQALAFHSDRADLTAMLCESTAASGGEFRICSSANLFYKLQEKPDILEILSTDIPHDLRDEGIAGSNICAHPIVSYKDVFWIRYIRKFITSTIRHGLILDKKIEHALDYIDNIINNKNFYHEISFQIGDFIIFNNHLTLHSRNAFVDTETQKRCLLRVWLSSEFSRELPESLVPVFHSVKGGSARGGIR